MRKSLLAGLMLAAAAAALAPPASAQPAKPPEAAPETQAPEELLPELQREGQTAEPLQALLTNDLDSLVRDAAANQDQTEVPVAYAAIAFFDAFGRSDHEAARAALRRLPEGLNGAGAAMFEPFLLVDEGRGELALERLNGGVGGLPDPYADIARALVLEALGRTEDAAQAYAAIEGVIDVRPGPEGEPNNEEELMRALNATRTSQTLYRAALVNHRLGNRAQAERLYGLVAEFSPMSADLIANRARLAMGREPVEAPLTPKSALGRWLFIISDFLQMTEGLAAVITAEGPLESLASPSGTMFLQFGLRLDPSADDWTISAASQLAAARSYVGAERLLAEVHDDSPWAADAYLSRAGMLIARKRDSEAVAAVERALALDSGRWSVLASAGDIFRTAGRDREAIRALDHALALVTDDEDRASLLSYRAYAHRFAGRLPDAVRDVNAARALHADDNIRYTAVAILMDDPQQWRDAIAIARQMFAEQPDSSNRLNSLGYALIQRPEGLEEGYRLLWRGFAFRNTDYAVTDSLGWAYYLYGHFGEARALIERANELTGEDKNPEILDHLGDVYWRLNEHDLARETWRAALDARPDATRRRALEEKIRRGLRTPAPAERELPRVDLPTGPRERGDT